MRDAPARPPSFAGGVSLAAFFGLAVASAYLGDAAFAAVAFTLLKS